MTISTIAGRRFDLHRQQVVDAMAGLLPEPLHEHYVVIDGTRFPPKQVLVTVTGLARTSPPIRPGGRCSDWG